MSHASIPQIYSDEIFASVIYLINRLPNTLISTPFTVLFHKPPDYSFLKVIGSLCFPYIKSYTSHKLEPKALPCIFIRYYQSQKRYRCLHLPTNRIYISRHVQFEEMIFPFQEYAAQHLHFDYFPSSPSENPAHY
jgi:hypothetical protein